MGRDSFGGLSGGGRWSCLSSIIHPCVDRDGGTGELGSFQVWIWRPLGWTDGPLQESLMILSAEPSLQFPDSLSEMVHQLLQSGQGRKEQSPQRGQGTEWLRHCMATVTR